ncbi:MAG: DUF1015 family protein [Actinobacteria bacterium]|uniref:Unannotated protein n=1 Tax=freshwater metagenome TaxID=449393 RepID=A0A6J7NGW6_9ZZZZ|nr:DUF1015 family protein [Actinomycetota bacterium]
MPRFEPFHALRFADNGNLGVYCAPPYDVLSDYDRQQLAAQSAHNIVHIDLPIADPPSDAYANASHLLQSWIKDGVLQRDDEPSLTLYRTSFTDETGKSRNIVGVIGSLEVVDEGAGGVLPHEQTTPKAKTDRLDLTRATDANLSPVWGLSTKIGLSALLSEPGEPVGSVVDAEGVIHSVERVVDKSRIESICAAVSSSPVVIADGHHRYAISRTFRDEVRARTQSKDTGAELTLTYINELVEEQLSVAAIHRFYNGASADDLRRALTHFYTFEAATSVDDKTLQEMNKRGSLVFIDDRMSVSWMTPKVGVFDSIRELDSARLEYALAGVDHTVGYQHGATEVQELVASGRATAAILIRPVSVDEIKRTANEGLLMPPKSTFFTPKLRTGLVMRELKTR